MAGLKDKVEEGQEQEEKMRQKSAQRKETESLFWAKFNLSPLDISSGAAPTAASTAAASPRPAAASSKEIVPEDCVLRAAPATAEAVPRFTYQSLSRATSNFKKRLGGGGCGSVFQGVLGSAIRVAVKRLELVVAPGAGAAGWATPNRSDAYRG